MSADTNTHDDLESIASILRSRERLLVTSHVNADGDAIGSCLAFARGLESIGKTVRIMIEDCASKYRFLDIDDKIEVLTAPPDLESLEEFDLGIVLDATEPGRIGVLESPFFRASFPKVCLDHHLEARHPAYLGHYLDPGAPAAGTLIIRLFDLMEIPLDRASAAMLFVAIATDTGWFRFSNTNAQVFRDMARLLECGADPEDLYSQVYENLPMPRLVLQGRLLGSMRTAFDGDMVWAALNHQEIQSSGVERRDFEGLIDPFRTIAGVKIVAFVTEPSPGFWKVSLRSRGSYDVQRVASRFGGGGHAKAAGCSMEGPLDEVMAILQTEVGKELERARQTVGNHSAES